MGNNIMAALQNRQREWLYPGDGILAELACEFIQRSEGLLTFQSLIKSVKVTQVLNPMILFLAKRIVVLTMPILALLDVLLVSTVGTVFRIGLGFFDIKKHICTCWRTLKVFLYSIPMTPIALIVPEKVYLTQKQFKKHKDYNELVFQIEKKFKSTDKKMSDEDIRPLIKKLHHVAEDCRTAQEVSNAQAILKKLHANYHGPDHREQFKKAKMKLEQATIVSSLFSKSKKILANTIINESMERNVLDISIPHLNVENEWSSTDELPQEIFMLNNLRLLRIDGGDWSKVSDSPRLKSIPSTISQLSNLETLLLFWHDKLTSIPSEICQLSKLRTLRLCGSNLRSLPSEMGSLSNLEILDLKNNRELRVLPVSLGQIPELRKIDISGTQISEAARDAILAQCKALRDERVA